MSRFIGITMLISDHKLYKEQFDSVSRNWFEFVNRSVPDALLVPFPNQKDKTRELADKIDLDMLILTGGNDIGAMPDRDEAEKTLVSYSLEKGVPILGVCRGMQLLNLYFGGTLNRDIAKTSNENHVKVDHDLRLERALKIEGVANKDICVNSFHNHGMMRENVSKELDVFAYTENGVVEGLYHKSRPVVGIQWHPERNNPAKSFDEALISNLINKVPLF